MQFGEGDGSQAEARARGVLKVRADVGEIDEGHWGVKMVQRGPRGRSCWVVVLSLLGRSLV